MIKYLGDHLDEFPGPANQTRCFVHTINLVVKAILKPFDVRRKKDISDFNDVAHALADSAEGHDDEEQEPEEDGEEDEEEDDDDENDAGLRPIRSTLLKVCLRVTCHLPKRLTHVELSYGKLPSRSKTPRPSFCRPGTRHSLLTAFPLV